MKQPRQNNHSPSRRNRGLWTFFTLVMLTILVLISSSGVFSKPVQALKTHFSPPSSAIQFKGNLSQSKLVQNQNSVIYLDVKVDIPEAELDAPQTQATNLVIVLDRSGSMSAVNKMDYAKAAIGDVLSRLGERDRFALVSFSSDIRVDAPLAVVTDRHRQQLFDRIAAITANGGTHLSAGLETAIALLKNSGTAGHQKILLLSDGQANHGIVDPQGLANIATQASGHEVVLSTIGMGLGFNETLMASLADHGMGHYAYLEDLSGLGSILAKDLSDSRQLYASGSHIDVVVGPGVRLLDAGGYPISQVNDTTFRVTSGQLLSGSAKQFVMTFEVSPQMSGAFSVADIHLNYTADSEQYRVAMNQSDMQIAVVAPERRQEAVDSIDKAVYQQSWLENNFGVMQKKVGHWLRKGKQDEARSAIASYRKAIHEAEKESDVTLASPVIAEQLGKLESKVKDAFTGAKSDQRMKQNRVAKSVQSSAIAKQRVVK